MKKLLYLVLVFIAFGCKDEPTDIRDAAVGRYTEQATFYTLQGTTLSQKKIVSADPVTISKVSKTDKIIIDFGNGDLVTGVNVNSSSTGFTFNLNPFVSSGFNFTGYAGYESNGNHTDGGFSKAGREIELWYQYVYNDTIKVVKCSMIKQ
jgi:hypothetical protein